MSSNAHMTHRRACVAHITGRLVSPHSHTHSGLRRPTTHSQACVAPRHTLRLVSPHAHIHSDLCRPTTHTRACVAPRTHTLRLASPHAHTLRKGKVGVARTYEEAVENSGGWQRQVALGKSGMPASMSRRFSEWLACLERSGGSGVTQDVCRVGGRAGEGSSVQSEAAEPCAFSARRGGGEFGVGWSALCVGGGRGRASTFFGTRGGSRGMGAPCLVAPRLSWNCRTRLRTSG